MSSREAGADRHGSGGPAGPDMRPPLPRGEGEAEEAAAARLESESDDPAGADLLAGVRGQGETGVPPILDEGDAPDDETPEERAARQFATRYPPETGTGTDPDETLRAFARPRMTGTPGADQVRQGVKRRLEALGYSVKERPFQFSAFPGRFALPLGGGILAVFCVTAAVLLGIDEAAGALVALVVGAVAAAAVARLAIPMVSRMPWGRVEGRNLLASPKSGRPRYLIMAHLDSKSQLVPLALRAPAAGVLVVGWLVLAGMAFATFIDPLPRTTIALTAIVVLAAGVLIALSLADNHSPGALDNASGLAALVAVAERQHEHGDIGFLVTDAEELGLAGARAIASELPPVFGVLNMDGLDDDGDFYIMERFGWRKRGLAPHMVAALLGAAADLNLRAERRDLPLGIMVDHIPIVEAGQPAVTLMRGTTRSLRRVHRPGDDLAALRGDGVRLAIDLVSAALTKLRAQGPEPR